MKYRKDNLYNQSDSKCRKCSTLMIEVRHKEIKNKHLKQPFYYSKWYVCPSCRAQYNWEEDKVWNHNERSEFLKNLEVIEEQENHLFSIMREN